MLLDRGGTGVLDNRDSGEAGVDVRHRRRAGVEAARVGGRRVVGDVHLEDVLVGEPAGLGGQKRAQQLPPDVQEAEPGRTEQILDRAARGEVDPERACVEIDRADRLVRVREAQRARLVRDPRDLGDVVPVARPVRDGRAADERRPLVDCLGEALGRDRTVGVRPHVDDLGPSQLLSVRDLADGGELVLADHDLGARAQVERGDDPAHALGHRGGHGELGRLCAQQPSEGRPRRVGPLDPHLPLCAALVPAVEVLLVRRTDAV